MGAKKKARSRQKQAVRDATVVRDDSSSPTSDHLMKENKGHLYHDGDDLHRFLVHIHTCKKNDSRRLMKFMPTLYHDLIVKGKHSPEQIVKDIMEAYDNKFHNMGDLERIAIMTKLRMATKEN